MTRADKEQSLIDNARFLSCMKESKSYYGGIGETLGNYVSPIAPTAIRIVKLVGAYVFARFGSYCAEKSLMSVTDTHFNFQNDAEDAIIYGIGAAISFPLGLYGMIDNIWPHKAKLKEFNKEVKANSEYVFSKAGEAIGYLAGSINCDNSTLIDHFSYEAYDDL